MNLYYFTFGVGQEYAGHVQPIKAPNLKSAISTMTSKYGDRWSVDYTAEEYELNGPMHTTKLPLITAKGGES